MKNSKVTVKTTQILQASVLGTMAFNNGLKAAPHFDKDLSKMIENRNIGETPKGEASSILLYKAWLNAWHNANRSKAMTAVNN